jgi:hypothetical protein
MIDVPLPAELVKKYQRPSADARIRAAFPEISPSSGHDLLDELIGLLRVTRGQRDDLERQFIQLTKLATEPQPKV